ncbi:hypothetical protein JW978_01605 [Candidatus Dojkabacteria bacterium]|nr:hypothetical protein [Candidatus Dojkabacteria bacterium]
MATKESDPKSSEPDVSGLRAEIDRLEAKIRAAEMAANAQLEEAAPLQTLLKWKAPERLYTQRGRPWYVTVAFITVIIIAYSALTGNYLLIVALITLLILLYAMNALPPRVIEHEITNKGLKTFDKIYTWNKIEGFWVSKRAGQFVMNIDLFDESIGRMILLLDPKQASEIVGELVKRVDYINPGGTGQDIISKLTEGKHVPITEFLDIYGESEKLDKEVKNPQAPQPAPKAK